MDTYFRLIALVGIHACSRWFVSGSLIQVLHEKLKTNRGRLGSFSSTFKEAKKETVRQVFLFTNHLLLTTRASNGRLHLAKVRSVCKLLDANIKRYVFV